ncbi:MAG: translation initiation factor IF-2 [Candidatus Aenigmarchaeota archaeon]|nr:translation initiation factor IF-2 [Candidatus Aenigmarchaeota archaeon]
MLRQPIIAVLGHVDSGKTSLLDRIRQTAVASKEAGGITQAIGTTEIPASILKEICDDVLRKFMFEIKIPGLLFIDTPGHEAFTSLRRRGGSIADLAILVVDIIEGLMPQTIESIEILKSTKTPFAVAINKIDRINGWKMIDPDFVDNYGHQSDDVQREFEEKFYSVVRQFSDRGLEVERFDRIQNFTKTIAAVPVSAKTGEGISDLLTILMGLAQQFLTDQLETREKSAGMILEVRDFIGLGKTIDVIIYNGTVRKNDYLVIGGKTPQISKIRTLLLPEALRDMRTEKKFRSVEEVNAAAGVKISAPGLDEVIAGSPIRTAKTFEEAEQLLEELEKEKEETEIHREQEGVILKADTVGSLEALIHIFGNYPVKEASIGNITKKDVIKAEANQNNIYKIVIGFNAHTAEEADVLAGDKNIKIMTSDVIYRLIEDYTKWQEEEKESIKKKEIEGLPRPGKIKLLPGCTFRASNPAIVGCEVVGGLLRAGSSLMKDGKSVGEIKQIQSQGQNIEDAKNGEKIAVSIIGPTVGRQIDESDVLFTDISSEDYKKLKKNDQFLTGTEKQALQEIFEIKRKTNPRYGL